MPEIGPPASSDDPSGKGSLLSGLSILLIQSQDLLVNDTFSPEEYYISIRSTYKLEVMESKFDDYYKRDVVKSKATRCRVEGRSICRIYEIARCPESRRQPQSAPWHYTEIFV